MGQPGCEDKQSSYNICYVRLFGGMYRWYSSRLATRQTTRMTQMQLKNVFFPDGSLRSIALSFLNFRGKFYLGEGVGDLLFFNFYIISVDSRRYKTLETKQPNV